AREVAERDVAGGVADQGDVDGGPDRGTVTGETPAHTLVRAGDGIEREVARGGVALRARRVGRNMVRGLGAAGHIAGKGRRGRVAAVAVTTGRMDLVQRGRTRVSRGARAAGDHPQVGCALVTGLTGGDGRRHRGVACDAERGTRDARGAELEAARIHIGRGVAARAVAVEAADRHVVARVGDEGDVGEGRGDRRTVTGETPGDALVRAGDGVGRVVARGGVGTGGGRA